MSNETVGDPESSLFDPGPRMDMRMQGYSEPAFEFLNRSAWACLKGARPVLELWLSRIPPANGKDIRGRFRGDDEHHVGALMELATHEILCAIGTDVRVAPDLGGKTPDFSFTYRGEKILVECTVAQDSRDKVSTLNIERGILDGVDSIGTGDSSVMLQVHQRGRGQPPTRAFRIHIEESSQSPEQGKHGERSRLTDKGWDITADLMSLGGSDGGGGAIGVVVGPVEDVESDGGLSSALRKKAGKYKPLQVPYVIVLGDNTTPPHPDSILHALRWSSRSFFGSPSRPRNRHVSGVLYKQGFRNVWSVCETDKQWQWQLYHHPEAETPLPYGLFPFATERFLQNGKPSETEPSCTVNTLLGLPDPWPGTDH